MNYRYHSSRSSCFFSLLLLTSLFTLLLPLLPPTLIFLSPSPCPHLRSCHNSWFFTSVLLTCHFKSFSPLLKTWHTVFNLLCFFHFHSIYELLSHSFELQYFLLHFCISLLAITFFPSRPAHLSSSYLQPISPPGLLCHSEILDTLHETSHGWQPSTTPAGKAKTTAVILQCPLVFHVLQDSFAAPVLTS